jgi:hypothetical protein
MTMATYDYGSEYESVSGEGDSGGRDNRPRHWAGSNRADIPAGQSVSFTINLNLDMDVEQLILPDDIADKVDVANATIGAVSLNAGDGPMPGSAFKQTSKARIKPAVRATPAVPVRITLQNVSGAPVTGARVGIVGAVQRAG